MSQPATRFTSIVFGISAIGAALVLCWAAISGADVRIFHVLYISLIALLALMCTSPNMRSGVVVTSLLVVLIALWVLPNASYVRPVLYNNDLNTEWSIVQYLVSNSHLPPLDLGTKRSMYASYPGLELITTTLDLVSGVAAYDFLTYGGALLSSITVLLAWTFYRRLLPQRSLATSALVVAAFSVCMIAYGALAIHQTLALVFVCLALVGLSLGRKSPLQVAILFSIAALAIVVSHILTGFLFLLLIAVYTMCTWILERRLDASRLMIESQDLLFRLPASLLLLYATVYLTWSAMVSPEIIRIGYSTIIQLLSSQWREYAIVTVTPKGVRAAWTTAFAVLGFGLVALVTLAGFFVSIRSRLSKLARLIPISLSGGAIFLMLYFVPIAGTPSAGIQGRSLLYAYVFGAPLFVVGLRFVSTRKPLRPHLLVLHRRVMPLLIIAVLLSPTAYYGLPLYTYDRTSPITGVDTRLGLAAEHGAYVFVSRFTSSPGVLAVDIAARMGALDLGTGTRISPIGWIVPRYYDSVGDLIRVDCRTIIIRQSIVRIPDSGYTVSTADYEYLLAGSNIVYSSGDPLVLTGDVIYCASNVPS